MRVLCQKKKHRTIRNSVPKRKKKGVMSGNESEPGFVDLVKSINTKKNYQNNLQSQKNGKSSIQEKNKSSFIPKSNTIKYYENTFLKKQAYPDRLNISRNLQKFSLNERDKTKKGDNDDKDEDEEEEDDERERKKQIHITKMGKILMNQLKEESMERESIQDIESNETEESEKEGKIENEKENEFSEFNHMEDKTKKKGNEIENNNDVVDTHLFDLLDEQITEKESEQQEPKEIMQNIQEEEKPLIDLAYFGIKKNYNILRELKKKI